MIEITRIHAQNIGPYAELEAKLSNRGIVLLTGKNGVGKSTIVDITQLGIYGRSSRYDSYKDMLRKGTDEGRIEIDLQVNDASLIVVRSILQNQQKLKLFRVLNDKIEDISGIHLEATQERLDRWLKTSWNVFSNIVTVSGEPVLFSETDGYQKSFMERMLGFEVYSEAQDLAKNYRRALEEEVSNLKLELSTKTNKQQTIKTQIETLSQKDIAVKKSKLEDARLQLQGLDADISGVDGEIDNLDTLIRKVDEDHDHLVESYKSYAKTVDDIAIAKNDVCGKMLLAEKELELAKKIADVKKCPTCLQNVSTEKQAQATERIARLTLEINNLAQDLKHQTEMHKDFLDEYMKVSSLKDRMEREIGRLESNKSTLRAEKGSLARRKGNLITRMEEIEKEAGAEIRPLSNDLSEIDIEISDITKSLQENQKTLAVIEFCIEAFGDRGIKSLLIEQYLMEISEAMNANLEFLTDGKMSAFLAPTKRLKSSTEFRDKMTLKVVDRDESEELLEYAHCSAGQRACVNLSALLAFHGIISKEKNVSWNILFLDEVLDSLDSERMGNMVRLLAKKVSEFPSIILTTHRPEFSEAFENVWAVKKKNGSSQLEES